MKKYGMLIDVQYCTGCHTCEVACQQENDYQAGNQFGIKVTEQFFEERKGLMIDYVPYITDMCNFCMRRVASGRKPTCVKHCLAQCMTFGTVEEVMEAAKNAVKPMVFLK